MLPVNLFIGAPFWVLCDECVFAANYLAFKICRETRVIFSESCKALAACYDLYALGCRAFYAQVAAQQRLPHIYILDLDFHFVLLTIGGLVTLESATGTKKG